MKTTNSYALIKEENGELRITEFATTKPEETRIVLKGAFAWAAERNLKTMKFAAPLPEGIRQTVQDLLPHRWAPDSAGMARPIDPDWPLERIQELFSRPDARFAPHEGF